MAGEIGNLFGTLVKRLITLDGGEFRVAFDPAMNTWKVEFQEPDNGPLHRIEHLDLIPALRQVEDQVPPFREET